MIKETEWEESVKKKIQYMANHIWNGLNFTDIEVFLSNFEKENKMVGWVLLDMLTYYSSEQEQSIISNFQMIQSIIFSLYANQKLISKIK